MFRSSTVRRQSSCLLREPVPSRSPLRHRPLEKQEKQIDIIRAVTVIIINQGGVLKASEVTLSPVAEFQVTRSMANRPGTAVI